MTPNMYPSGSGAGGRGDRLRRSDSPPATSWTIERRRGAAGSLFFASSMLADGVQPGRRVRVLEVEGSALVLGSTQPAPPTPTPSSEGMEVVRRRSGGGAVLLRPGETVWVDVVIPRRDPLWDDDVGRSFHWLGHAWVIALARFGVAGVVHRGALVASRWSSSVCFAGIGAGEVVVVGRDGGPQAKVVGMASRRTRHGALFQCAVPLAWEPAAYVDLLGLPAEAAAELAGLAAPVAGAAAGDVADALVAALPT